MTFKYTYIKLCSKTRMLASEMETENALAEFNEDTFKRIISRIEIDGEICINEPEAELIKAIFELYTKGKSYSEIAQRCMLTGIRYNPDSDKF